MAKRRAEDILINIPSKKCGGLCSVDMRLDSMAPSKSESQLSLFSLLGSRCKKRPLYFDENEETDLDLALFRKGTHGDLLKHSAQQQHTSGYFHETRISDVVKSANKRARKESEEPADTTIPKPKVEADTIDNNDSSYNSFQFWRAPLPELDMSLLQELLQKDSSHAMET